MVKATQRSEKEYRSLELDSYSTLALFSKDRRKYYRRFILREEVEDEDDDTLASLIGGIVHCLISDDQEEFDRKYHLSSIQKKPTGKALDFVNALYKRTLEATNKEGVIETEFKDLMALAYKDADLKKPLFENYPAEFIKSGGEEYYKEMRIVRPTGKKIVCLQDIDNAKKIENELKTNHLTEWIINLKTNTRYTVHNELQIEGFDINGLLLKAMLDKLIIDHEEKTAQIFDLKVTYDVENFYEGYYLYRKAYIQPYVYLQALLYFLQENGMGEYIVLPTKFIVCDSINYLFPLLYECTEESLLNSYKGFEYKNREYVGVREIIKDLAWAKENQQWRISRTNHENKGIIQLK